MTEEQGVPEGADTPKNVGRRRLLQMLTAGGGLAAAGLLPAAWNTPAADLVGSAPASAGVAPSPPPTSPPPTPSVSVSVTVSPPPPTPAPGPLSATPPFTG